MRTASSGGRSLLGFLVISCLSAVACLYIVQIDPGRVHLLGLDHTLNDQAVYIDAARHIRDDGMLYAGAYYPSTLLQDYGRNYFYMPGHAAVLFASISLLGDSPFAALAPGLISYILCIACLFLLCRRMIGSSAGFAATAGFLAFPPFLVYAASAMAEMTFLASGAVVYTVFTYLPPGRRHLLVPVLIVVPFMFRESGVVWLLPIVSQLLTDSGFSMRTRLSRATVALLGSLAVLAVIMFSEWAGDRPSLFLQNLYGSSFEEKYTSAIALDTLQRDPSELVRALLERAGSNISSLLDILSSSRPESIFLHLVLWPPFIASISEWRKRRIRPLVASWALTSMAFILFISFLYRWDTMIGLRHMLTPAFTGLLVTGSCIDQTTHKLKPWMRAILAVVLIAASSILYLESADNVTEWDGVQDKAIRVMDEAGVPEGGVLISDISLGPIYLFSYPGSGWLLPPSDEPTLRLADEKLDITGILLFESDRFWVEIDESTIEDIGMTRYERTEGLILMSRE